MDQSHLDSKYFIDEHVYNCPFCNRGNVQYFVESHKSFDWSKNKQCNAYFVTCTSCEHTSMHLSYDYISLDPDGYNNKNRIWRFSSSDKGIDLHERELDEIFFYSVPTSFFAIDERIPRVLRELLTEAEGCLKSNFLTGASACARKVIYEIAELEDAEGENYDERIRSLKEVRTDVDSTYFDTLITIQEMTSSKVHEKAYDGWESEHLRLILSILTEILHEMYVIPAVRKEKRSKILEVKQEVIQDESSSNTDN